MFCIYRISDGQAVSFGTVVADPLPDGLAAVDVGDITGKRWDPQALAMVDVPAPEPQPTAADILAEAATLPSPVTPADLADILARAAAAIEGGV